MISEKVNICFKNFHPEKKFYDLVRRSAQMMQMKAPYDSVLTLSFEQNGALTKGLCHIASLTGVFQADAIAPSLSDSLGELQKKIGAQIREWKKRRFQTIGVS